MFPPIAQASAALSLASLHVTVSNVQAMSCIRDELQIDLYEKLDDDGVNWLRFGKHWDFSLT